MQLIWNLDDLFLSNEAFYEEIKTVDKLINNLELYKHQEFDETSLLSALNDYWKIKERTNNILIYGSLKYYQDVNSQDTITLKTDAEKFLNDVNLKIQFIEIKIIAMGKEKINELIKKNPNLEIYKHYLDNLFRIQDHVKSEIKEEIAANNNQINEELTKYNSIINNLEYGTVTIDGKEEKITNANINKYLASREQSVRASVYKLVNHKYLEHTEKLADILNTIYQKRNQNMNIEEYDSVLNKILFEENIDPKIITALINGVNNNLELMQRYLKIKADQIDISNPHLYDYNVPLVVDLDIEFSIEEAINIIKEALKPLGPDYLKAIDYLLSGHIDATLNETKHQSITFSWNTYSFLNFHGKYNDLKNLIHELGHIVNYYFSKNNLPYLYEDSSIFVGEVASIVNELLLSRYLIDHAKNEQEKLFYLSKEVENYITSVYKQVMYTEYEHSLYNLSINNKLTVDLLSNEYAKILHHYYGNNTIYDLESNIEWTRIGKLYRWSYYSYKYATGLIMASIVANNILSKELSSTDYIKFLSSGSSMYSLDLLKMLNIDLLDLNVIATGFNNLNVDVNEIEDILKK